MAKHIDPAPPELQHLIESNAARAERERRQGYRAPVQIPLPLDMPPEAPTNYQA